jgi:hypothetical protein
VIRNAVIHAANEQPLLVDLYAVPAAADAGLLCTNLRMMDGKRPIFIDSIQATFFFPYHVIRFLEIPPESLARHAAEGGAVPGTAGSAAPPEASPDPVPGDPDSLLPVAVAPPAEAPPGDLDLDIELDIDEGFLQRVRDI